MPLSIHPIIYHGFSTTRLHTLFAIINDAPLNSTSSQIFSGQNIFQTPNNPSEEVQSNQSDRLRKCSQLWWTLANELLLLVTKLSKKEAFSKFSTKGPGQVSLTLKTYLHGFWKLNWCLENWTKICINWNQNSIWIIHRKKTFNSSVEKDPVNRGFIFCLWSFLCIPNEGKGFEVWKGPNRLEEIAANHARPKQISVNSPFLILPSSV